MADIKAKRLRFTKNGVSHIFEGGGSSDGIMAEGNVRGVRTLIPSVSVPANAWKALKMSYLDGDEIMLNSDGNFIAPSDGIYMVSARPDDSATHSSIAHITSINKGTEYTPESTLAYAKSNTTTGSGILQASCVVKLKAGDVITVNVYVASAQTIKNQSVAMPCEFYQISERTDGLVAEAKYETKANWPVDWVNCTYSSSTDTDVIALDGTITLPEDGNYLLSWDSLMPSNYASHVNHSGLSKTPTGTAILDWLWYETYTTAFVMLAGAQVISGKKGEKFYLKNYQATAQNSKTFTDEGKTHGVKLFKMSLAGGGGGGGIDDPTEIISDDDGNAIVPGSDGNLYVKDLEPKIDSLNFAQKTVNGRGNDELLSTPQTFTLTKASTGGTIVKTAISKDITFEDDLDNYDSLVFVLRQTKQGTTGVDFLSENFQIRTKNIVFNNSNTQNLNDGSYLELNFRNVATAANAWGVSMFSFSAWFKDKRTLYINEGFNPRPDARTLELISITGIKDKPIVIDPVEYVNTTSGIEDTPVGHILAHMGTTPPKHYLAADGSVYNITDYPHLAEHIKADFGTYNHFGGDGTTTFAVPDLQGEFLRGTGTNSHENQGSGGEVGEHQDGTLDFGTQGYNTQSRSAPSTYGGVKNEDYRRNTTMSYRTGASEWTAGGGYEFIARPTNTSVLYCIKYEPTYFMKPAYPGGWNGELTVEHWTGETLNGKPVYEKTFLYTTPSANSGVAFSVEELNIETLVSVNGSMLDGSNYYLVDGSNYNNNLSYALYINNDGKTMNLQINPNTMTRYFNRPALATLKYTKTTD